MTLCCPRCHSVDLRSQQRAEHTCSLLGVTAGAAVGLSSALAGAEAGAITGALIGPLGVIAEALLGTLTGGTAGFLAGIKLGRMVDQALIGDLECNYCGHVFFDKTTSA